MATDSLPIESARPEGSVTGCPAFDYAPGQPNLYKMMRHKQALIAESGVSAGFARFCQTFGLPPTLTLQEMSLAGERAHAQAHGLLFHEVSPAGERFISEPPTVWGDGQPRAIHGVSRSQYVACFHNARVRGRSAVIVCDERILLDVQDHERGLLNDERDWDPAIFAAGGDRAQYLPARDEDDPLVFAEAFTLLGAHTDFFGHWICEYLPKWVSAHLSGVLPEALPVLIDAHMPPSHRQALDLLFGDTISVHEIPALRSVRVGKLWCAPTLMYMPLHEKLDEKFSWDIIAAAPQRFAPVIREMTRRADLALPARASGAKRLFLARKAFRHRKLVNSTEIESLAAAAGFRVVYAEEFSFAEQIGLIRDARFILASEGSSIFLAFFARPSTRLGILSHPSVDALSDYNGILAAHGIETLVRTGPITRFNAQTPQDSDYRIEPDALVSFLRVLCDEKSQASTQ